MNNNALEDKIMCVLHNHLYILGYGPLVPGQKCPVPRIKD